MSSSSAWNRVFAPPYMASPPALPSAESGVTAPDVRHEIVVERPFEIVQRRPSPVAARARVVDVLRPRIDDRLAARVRLECDARRGKRPTHDGGQLTGARAEC